MSDSKKLKKLKEIRRKNLEKNLLDIELKGYDHYIFINERNKAQVVSKQGGWVTEHIRTAILKFNYEIDKIDKLLITYETIAGFSIITDVEYDGESIDKGDYSTTTKEISLNVYQNNE